MAADISSSRHTGDLKQDELRGRDHVANDGDGSHSKRDDRRRDLSKPVHEEGKMFIGGLNWETTDESLRTYFSQFGEVTDCVVMRDPNTGRSRGFGFLTFVDSSVVNTVLVKEHHLDGKIIDPKRAIPREEQEKTEKIFVGGIAPEVTEDEFKEYFTQFGNVIDATLMVDRDTGRPRGFGFITFDSSEPVERAMARRDLEIRGKPIEVKRAMPKHKSQRAQSMYNQSYGSSPVTASAAASMSSMSSAGSASRYGQGYSTPASKDVSIGYSGVYGSNSYPNYGGYGQAAYSSYNYPSSYPTGYSGYNAMTQAYYSRYANSYNQYSGYSNSGSRGGSSYSQWYRGDGGYGSGGPSSGGSASPLPGPSSVGRMSGGYRGSPGRDDVGYSGRDQHHHHHHSGSPAYGRGSSRTGAPMRSYSSSIQTNSSGGGGGPLYSSQQVRSSHNYHPYAR